MLPCRHPHERTTDGCTACLTQETGLLFPRAARGGGGSWRRDREGRRWPGTHDRRRDRRDALPEHPFPRATGARAASPGIESRVEDVLPGAARAGVEWGYDRREPWARPGERPAPGMAGVPPPAGVPNRAGERERALTGPCAG